MIILLLSIYNYVFFLKTETKTKQQRDEELTICTTRVNKRINTLK